MSNNYLNFKDLPSDFTKENHIVINLQLDVGEVVEVVLIALEAGLERRVGALVARVVHRVQLQISSSTRVAKCQIFYTDKIEVQNFTPKTRKSLLICFCDKMRKTLFVCS